MIKTEVCYKACKDGMFVKIVYYKGKWIPRLYTNQASYFPSEIMLHTKMAIHGVTGYTVEKVTMDYVDVNV